MKSVLDISVYYTWLVSFRMDPTRKGLSEFREQIFFENTAEADLGLLKISKMERFVIIVYG